MSNLVGFKLPNLNTLRAYLPKDFDESFFPAEGEITMISSTSQWFDTVLIRVSRDASLPSIELEIHPTIALIMRGDPGAYIKIAKLVGLDGYILTSNIPETVALLRGLFLEATNLEDLWKTA